MVPRTQRLARIARARDAHVTRIVSDVVSFLSSMPRPRSFLHGADLGLGMADKEERMWFWRG